MSHALYQIRGFKFAYAVSQLLPRSASHWIARSVALASAARRPEARVAMVENLRCATGRETPELHAMYDRGVTNFARMLADYFITSAGRRDLLEPLFDAASGWENVQSGLAKGRGVIVATGHLGHWELGAQWLACCKVPLTIVTMPEPSPELTQWRGSARRQLGIGTLEVGPGREFSFVEMLAVLRRNEALAVLVDRPYEGTGVPVKQFGLGTQYSMAAAMLAHHTGAAVIPAFVFAQKDWRYSSMAMPEVPMERGSLRQTLQPNTQRIADIFQSLISQHPEQWFNYVPLYSQP
jgi:KDO2-lipid IV(A) lauroyltransferase